MLAHDDIDPIAALELDRAVGVLLDDPEMLRRVPAAYASLVGTTIDTLYNNLRRTEAPRARLRSSRTN